MLTRLVAWIVIGTAGAVSAQDGPRFSGTWTLNRELSQDLAAKIKDAAGSAHMSGGAHLGSETWLPWGADFSEPERITVREYLLTAVPSFDALEIEQDAEEVKTLQGENHSRIFNLKRKSAGRSAMTGETVAREARVQGQRLTLESKGKGSRLLEVMTLEPSGDRLVYQLRLEQKLLEKPLEARLVYDRRP